MISFLEGILVRMDDNGDVVLDNAGVGYAITVSDRFRTEINAKGPGAVVVIPAVRQHFREELHRLFGFATLDDRAFFDAAVKIKGIGPSVALKVLAKYDGADAFAAVGRGDPAAFNLPGIGKITAPKLLLVRLAPTISDPELPLPPTPKRKRKSKAAAP